MEWSSNQANAIKSKKCNVLTYSLNTWRHLTPIQCMARCSSDSHNTPTFTWFYSRDSSKVQTPIYEKLTLLDGAVSTKLDLKRSIMDPAAGMGCVMHVRMATTMMMIDGEWNPNPHCLWCLSLARSVNAGATWSSCCISSYNHASAEEAPMAAQLEWELFDGN
jgi:hypothetical protein